MAKQTVKKSPTGKNALWAAYKAASRLQQREIMLELEKVDLDRHWYGVASMEGHDLPNAKGKLRDIFLKYLPEPAPLFGKRVRYHKAAPLPQPAPLFDQVQD